MSPKNILNAAREEYAGIKDIVTIHGGSEEDESDFPEEEEGEEEEVLIDGVIEDNFYGAT